MRRTKDELDSTLDATNDAESVRVVTRDLADTIDAAPVAETTTAFHGYLGDVVADIGDAVFAVENPNDFIVGTAGNDVLSGGDGDDLIAGGLGDDTLNGAA